MSVYYIKNNSIDNFQTLMKIEYVGVEDHILTEEELQQQNKVELYEDTTIFVSDSVFIGYPIRIDNTIRPANKVELINMGYQQLEEGEYIEGNEVIKIERPSYQYLWNKLQNKWLPDETKLRDGDYIEGENIKHIPYDKKLGYLKPIWNKVNHTWEEQATEQEVNLHQAKGQYKEYAVLDTPLNFEKMVKQGILAEYKTMMNELESIIDTLSTDLSVFSNIVLPKPSKNLIDFKNKFNKLF